MEKYAKTFNEICYVDLFLSNKSVENRIQKIVEYSGNFLLKLLHGKCGFDSLMLCSHWNNVKIVAKNKGTQK